MHRVASALLLCACASGPFVSGAGGGSGGGFAAGGGSGGGATGGSGGSSGLPLKGACSVLNAARCLYYERCGLIDSTTDAQRDCAAWLLATWCGPTLWPARIDVGTLLYDPITAQVCVDAFTQRACSDFEVLPTACTHLTSPNVLLGQSCYDGYAECTESRVCRGSVCPRTCQPLGIASQVCRVDADCQSPLYCRTTVAATGIGTCTEPGMVSALCTADEPCAAGLSCIAGRCATPPSEGDYCATGGICDDLTWCRSTADGGVCTAKLDGGTACTDDVQCGAGFLCQTSCVSRIVSAAGLPCSDRQVCPKGTTCVGATATRLGSCGTPLNLAQPCISSDDCLKPLACVPVDAGLQLACNRRQPNHESCTFDRDCQLLSRCKGGLCTRLPNTGQSCLEAGACAAGPCVGEPDGGAFCADKLGPGALCQLDEDCASNRCASGACLPACAP